MWDMSCIIAFGRDELTLGINISPTVGLDKYAQDLYFLPALTYVDPTMYNPK